MRVAGIMGAPLGLVVKANTDGAEGIEGVSNTFVYTVLLMVTTGVTIFGLPGQAQNSSHFAVSSEYSRPSAIFPSRTTKAMTVPISRVFPLLAAWACWIATV